MGGDARVDEVDDPAEDAGGVKQGGRAAEDLHLAERKRVDRHGVVRAGRGGVQHGRPILHDPDLVAVEAAHDRPSGVRSELAVRHAEQITESLADVARRGTGELGGADEQRRRIHAGLGAEDGAFDRDGLQRLGRRLREQGGGRGQQ